MDNVRNDLERLKNKMEILTEKVEKTNSVLTGLNILNIVAFQKSVNDLGLQLEKIRNFNEEVRYFKNNITNFNKLLEPVNKLAKDKLIYSEIHAKTKEKEFTLNLAKLKTTDKELWNEYRKLESEKNLMNTTNILLIGSLCIGGFVLINKL